MNPKNIVTEFKRLIIEKFTIFDSIITEEESSFAKFLFSAVEAKISHPECFEEYETLDVCSENEETDVGGEIDESGEETTDYVDSDETSTSTKPSFDLKYMEAAVSFMNTPKGTRRKFSTVQNRFKNIPSERELFRWKKYVEKQGTKKQKMSEINDFVKNKFIEARNNCLPVHDNDLKKWSIEKSSSLNFSFKASNKWVLNFKRNNRVTSRKTTKIVSAKYKHESDKLVKAANDFVSKIKNKIDEEKPSVIINTDQSGFNYEIASTRTHDVKRSKHVIVQA